METNELYGTAIILNSVIRLKREWSESVLPLSDSIRKEVKRVGIITGDRIIVKVKSNKEVTINKL